MLTRPTKETALFWFLVAAALSCGGLPAPPQKEYPAGEQPPEVDPGEKLTWRAPLFPDAANAAAEGGGVLRVRNQEEYFAFRLLLAGLRSGATYDAYVEGNPFPNVFSTDVQGRANVLLGVGGSVPLPGVRIRVADPSGTTLFVGALPDWSRVPFADGPRVDRFESGTGGETVRVEAFSGSGRGAERLAFRFAGFEPGAASTLRIAGGEGIPFVPGENGRAVLRWTAHRPRPLPDGAYTVRELRGRGFEVRDPGGATVLEGAIP